MSDTVYKEFMGLFSALRIGLARGWRQDSEIQGLESAGKALWVNLAALGHEGAAMEQVGSERDPQEINFEQDFSGVPRDLWIQSMTDMLDVVGAAFFQRQKYRADAEEIARISLSALAEYFGGRSFYLPKGMALRNVMRDNEIWRKSRNTPVADLARDFKLTEQRIYQIINEERLRRLAETKQKQKVGT